MKYGWEIIKLWEGKEKSFKGRREKEKEKGQ
jgi:hypothetical protein